MADSMLRRVKRKAGRVVQPLAYSLYYATCTRAVPFKRKLAALSRNWEKRRRKGDAPAPKDWWEKLYAAGVWDYMASLEESPRYSIIAGYLKHLKHGGSIVDVGCGEGLLLRQLCPTDYERYVGIDISETAIAVARESSPERATFLVANAAEFVLPGKYDAVVFNESLYLFDEPLTVAGKYADALRDDGVMIVSSFLNSRRSRCILRTLHSTFALVDEVTQRNGEKAWTCSIFAPVASSANGGAARRG